jgi:hypothetical protein
MALSLASPGVKVREVDLTRGGVTNTTSSSATARKTTKATGGSVNSLIL